MACSGSFRRSLPALLVPWICAACGVKERGRTVHGRVDYVIVAGNQLAASARRYKAFRERTGHVVELALVKDIAPAAAGLVEKTERIRAFIKKKYDERDPKRPFYVLLLGDADDPMPAGRYTEPFNRKTIVSDNYYADPNEDHVPELAVGRIPAGNDAELDAVRTKIERYEATYTTGELNRRMNIIAAPGGFGAFIDSLIEKLAYQLLDAWSYKYDVTFTYASSSSPAFYVPEAFSDKVVELMNKGSLLTVYVGHGMERALDAVEWQGRYYPILDVYGMRYKLRMHRKPAVVLIFACLTGSFAGKDCLAEKMLRLDGGPVAVIASTDISHPYPNAVLLRDFGFLAAKHAAPTVGLLFLATKVNLIRSKGYCRKLIDGYGRMVISDKEMEAQKRTHLHMYTLFGDPAMKMAYVAGRAKLLVGRRTVKRGASLSVGAMLPGILSGTARFTLETRREVIRGEIRSLPVGSSTQVIGDMIKANYERANNKVVTESRVSVSFGVAHTILGIPPTAEPGTFFVKVYAHDGVEDRFGHWALEVTR